MEIYEETLIIPSNVDGLSLTVKMKDVPPHLLRFVAIGQIVLFILVLSFCVSFFRDPKITLKFSVSR